MSHHPERGTAFAEGAAVYAPLLTKAGYSAVEVTGGSSGESTHASQGPLKKEEWFEGYYLEAASQVKAACDVPVVAVGGIRRLSMVSQILSDGMADLISLSRPFIREPSLIKRWAEGDPTPAACISCNGCLKIIQKGKQLSCVQSSKNHFH